MGTCWVTTSWVATSWVTGSWADAGIGGVSFWQWQCVLDD